MPFNNHPLLSYNYGGFTPIKVVGGLAFIYALLEFVSRRKGASFLSLRQSRLFFIFTAIFLLSYFTSEFSNSISLLRFSSIWLFFITTVILLNSRARFFNAMLCIIFCMDLASAYMFREFSLYGSLYSNFRPGGIFGDSNYFAISAVAAIPIAYFLYRQSEKGYLKMFYLGSLLLMTCAVALSQSRGGMIGFAAMFLVVLFYRKFQIRTIAVVGIAIATAIVLAPNDVFHRFNSEETGVKVSTEARLALIESGMEMASENLLLGVGPGNFKPMSTGYSERVKASQIAHNSYLEMAAELGIFGLAVFFLMAWTAWREAGLRRIEARDDAYLTDAFTGIKAGLAGYLVAAIFLSAEYEKMYWFLVFAVAASSNFVQPLEKKRVAAAPMPVMRAAAPAASRYGGGKR